ncbi:hypothetical protein [Amycolatopsis kentuckyensis]|uniref:hypothetical protein n=1 Tax=Amycolatopsis kentuckyensis TaxID=218823 RepID=UPI0035634356
MVLIRKDRAGSASHGYSWAEDGDVVDVAPEHAAGLLEIPDGGFHEHEPVDEPAPEPAGLVDLNALAAHLAAAKAAAAAAQGAVVTEPDAQIGTAAAPEAETAAAPEAEADLAGLAAREDAATGAPVPTAVAPDSSAETAKPRARGGRKTAQG